MNTVYVSDPIDREALAAIRAEASVLLGFGAGATPYPAVAARVDAVLTRGLRVDRAAIDASPRLRIIARHGVGFDGVDVVAATERGIWVTTTPGSNAVAVAEHVFALLLELARGVGAADAALRCEGRRSTAVGFELRGKRIGIVGFGAIGGRVAAIAHGFGLEVLAHDPLASGDAIRAAGAEPLPLAALLAASDVLTVHVPLTSSTRYLIDVGAMKPGAILVNTSRGGVVDDRAVVAAIRSGHLAGAALDVLESEHCRGVHPLAHLGSPLPDPRRLVLTPHIAGQTEQALRQTGLRAWASIQAVLAGREPADAVNRPVRASSSAER
ncbi:hydroxyacid dehydrogenase [Microbacteriaceae bacterium VKM Ac-2854]|nr:hydroxyacid dehydrogenase [Microbacteriaceae bacterium VKM Ac-2854]